MNFVGKAKQCFVYNTKIIETPTTKEVYFYETPIYSHSNSDSKTSNTQAHKRKVFDEMSAHKQYDSLKRKQKHYEQTRWEIARIVDCNFDNKTKFLTLTFRENIQDITITNKGTPKSVVASMLGHTTEVNEKYYTYDTSNLAEKKKIIQERNAKFKNLAHTG